MGLLRPCTAATSAHRRASGVAPGLFTFTPGVTGVTQKVLRNVLMNTLTRRPNRARPNTYPHRHTGTSFASCSSSPDTPRYPTAASPAGGQAPLGSTEPPLHPLPLQPPRPSPQIHGPLLNFPAHTVPEGRPPAISVFLSLSEPESPIHTFSTQGPDTGAII